MSTLTDKSLEAPDLATATEWPLRRSIGWQIPAGVAVVSLGIFTACLVYVFSKPIALATFAAAVLALATLLLALLAGLLGYGCYSARYRLEHDALAIEWLWMTELVPLSAIDGLYSGQHMERVARVEGLVWPGHYLGKFQAEGLGWVKLLGTSINPPDLFIVTTAGTSFALTPDDVAGFRGALIERLNVLDVQEVDRPPEAGTLMPQLLRLSILRDSVAVTLLITAGLVLAVSYGYISARFPSLPDLISLRFNQAGVPIVVGPPIDAFRMPVVGTIILAANALVATALHGRQADSSRLLAGATVFVQLVMLVAVLAVV